MRKLKRWYKQFTKEDKIGCWVIMAALICGIVSTVIKFVESGNYEQLYDNIIMLTVCIIVAIAFFISAVRFISKSSHERK